MNRIPRLLVMVTTGLALASPALAQVGTTTRSDVDGPAVDWSTLGPSRTTVASGTSMAVGGTTMTVTSFTGSSMERRDQGSGWNGDFAPGESLLWTAGTNGPLIFSFDQLLSGFGANVQSDSQGPFTATIALFRGALEVGSFAAAGVSTLGTGGPAIFIGMLATSSETMFDRVELGVPSALAVQQQFAINGPVISTAVPTTVTPEPMSLALLGSGLLGLGGVHLRRRRRSPIC